MDVIKKFFIFLFCHAVMSIKIDNKKHFWDIEYKKVGNLQFTNNVENPDLTVNLVPRLWFIFILKILFMNIDTDIQKETYTYTIKNMDRLKRNNIKLKYDINLFDTKSIVNIYCKKKDLPKIKLMGIFE